MQYQISNQFESCLFCKLFSRDYFFPLEEMTLRSSIFTLMMSQCVMCPWVLTPRAGIAPKSFLSFPVLSGMTMYYYCGWEGGTSWPAVHPCSPVTRNGVVGLHRRKRFISLQGSSLRGAQVFFGGYPLQVSHWWPIHLPSFPESQACLSPLLGLSQESLLCSGANRSLLQCSQCLRDLVDHFVKINKIVFFFNSIHWHCSRRN